MSAGTDLACPLSEQRNAREAQIGYLTVLVTVLPMFGHLLSLRDVQHPLETVLLLAGYFMNPIFPALLLLRHLFTTLCRVSTMGINPKLYAASAAGLHVPLNEERRESAELAFAHYWQTIEVRPNNATRDGKWLGRVMVVLVIMLQCLGSVILGIRRRQHGADTASDNWCLLHSISGLCILSQSMLLLVLNKSCHQSSRSWTSNPPTLGYLWDGLMWTISWLVVVSYIGFNEYGRPLAYIYAGVISSGALLYLSCGDWLVKDFAARVCLGLVSLAMFVPLVYLFLLVIQWDISHQLGLDAGPWPEDKPCPLLWQDSFMNGILVF
jgi:hypothetical protein